MIKSYIFTITSRYFVAILNLAVVLLCSHFLGAEGLGFVSLFVLGLAINQQLCSFFGGGALVYLTPRRNAASLILISYTGATLVHIALVPVYLFLKPFSPALFPAFFCISLMNAYMGINLFILLGKERVEAYNLISTFQVLLQSLIFALFAFKVKPLSTDHYIIAAAIGYFMGLAGSSGVIFREVSVKAENVTTTFRDIVKYGFYSESGNILQLLSYRLNYFLVNKWLGLAALGEFSLAVQLTESLRIFSKGIATVEYARYSNNANISGRPALNRRTVIFSLVFTFVGLLILLLLPSSIINLIFGHEFPHIKTIVAILAPGILLLSAGTVIAPFFSGQGKHYINAIASAISFVIIAVFSFLLIPGWGLPGAALVSTMAYTAITLYLFLRYKSLAKPL